MAESYDLARTTLAASGYEHYEISNFAKPGFASEHNRKYWRRAPYLGFGAGAHSFSGSQRWANHHDAAAYVQVIAAGKIPTEQLEMISPPQALEENCSSVFASSLASICKCCSRLTGFRSRIDLRRWSLPAWWNAPETLFVLPQIT